MSNHSLRQSARVALMLLLFIVASLPAPAQQKDDTAHRIQFKPGQTSAVVRGTVKRGADVTYELRARQGQRLTLRLTSSSKKRDDVVFSLAGPNGNEMGGSSGMGTLTDFSGELSSTSDYLINVSVNKSRVARYMLEVAIK